MTPPAAKAEDLLKIVSGGLSIMSVHSEFHHDAEDHVAWTIRLVENASGRYFAAGQLRASGKSSRGSVDVVATVTLPSELADKGIEAIKDAFPHSSLNHGLYDMAATALRTALGLTASDLRIDTVTPETKVEILPHAKVQELRKTAQNDS